MKVLVTFRSERDAQTFLRDEIAEQYGATAALAAQECERPRGGLRVLGCTGNDMCTATEQHVSFCPLNPKYGATQGDGRGFGFHTVAQHDAAVLRAAADDLPPERQVSKRWLRLRADRIEAQP